MQHYMDAERFIYIYVFMCMHATIVVKEKWSHEFVKEGRGIWEELKGGKEGW